MEKVVARRKGRDEIHSWINSSEGKEKLNAAYECTKKVVDELIESRFVDSETLYRPFNK